MNKTILVNNPFDRQNTVGSLYNYLNILTNTQTRFPSSYRMYCQKYPF